MSDSVPQKSKGVVVEASPLNQVKFELGIAMVLALLLLLVIPTFIDDLAVQLIIFAGFGLGAAAWLVLRVRKAVAAFTEQESGEKSHQE